MIMCSKAQSAMEYLMTYGWAILIISVVLGALFSLGVFSGASLIGTSCTASPGYYCGGVTYSHTTGNMIVTIGQTTGTNWASTAFLYAPPTAASTSNAPAVLFGGVITTGLASGQTNTITFGVSASSTPIGTTTAGDIWVCYTTITGATVTGALGYCTASSAVYYAQVASLTAKSI